MKTMSKNQQLIKHNPRISEKLVEGFEALDKELKKFGVDTRPKYSVSPPLGGCGFQHIFNRCG